MHRYVVCVRDNWFVIGGQMAREPNAEQQKAIEHTGGVSLSAGAGSGKTFVLVEHIYSLTMKKLSEFSHESDDVKELELKKLYSSIVLMTFTNKAAGEISIRLHRRFDELEEEQLRIVKKSLTQLSVTTIHGFCFKLIQRGYFDKLTGDSEILTEEKFRHKISVLITQWYSSYKEKLTEEEAQIVLSYKRNLEESFFDVFSQPEVRREWDRESLEISKSLDDILLQILELLELEHLLTCHRSSSLADDLSDFKKAKWVDYLLAQEKLFLKQQPLIDKLLELYDFYKSNRRSAVSKKAPEEIQDYAEQTKRLQKFCVDYYEDLYEFNQSGEQKVVEWASIVKSIFDYVSQNYFSIKGLTFSDLEYYVDLGLEDSRTLSRIQSDYHYLIVDEFQDTSRIQFSIIRKIIGDDFSKLFCVGDIKQAIYGFRGGEIGVFEECIKLTPQKLSLLNNYRSKEKIIKFNNLFFDFLFPLGEKYAKLDKFSVVLEHQNTPLELESKGSVECLQLNLEHDSKKSLNQTELNYLESQLITNYLVDLKQRDVLSTQDNICILYKNLTPLKFLLQMLLKESKLSFTCQAKIPLAEDPILSLFQVCLEYAFERDSEPGFKNSFYYQVVIEQVFSQLNLGDVAFKHLLDFFYDCYKNLGVRFAVVNVMANFGISNSGQENNLLKIFDICDYCLDQPESIYLELQKYKQKNYSLEFQKGSNPKEIQIMTTHASKGLEFYEVILGGIHTNGSSRSDSLFFGCHPRSFKWMKSGNKKKVFKTPELIHEEILKKKKNFSETKRLFYVATTRAVNKLTWFDISLNSKEQSYSDNSWIVGLREYVKSSMNHEKLITFKEVSQFQNPFETQAELDVLQPPLFHNDDLGIAKGKSERLLIFSELSVTRLAMLAECPRKFYLKNILKLEMSESESPSSYVSSEEDIVFDKIDKKHSASERGTLIHQYLSDIIKSSFTFNLDYVDFYQDEVQWTLGLLKSYQLEKFSFYSEEEWKFEIFGQMISGTPDLILIKDQTVEVWDFKTGKRNSIKDSSYWFQLKCYAYACYEKFSLNKDQSIIMKLIFIDSQEVEQISLKYFELHRDLFSLWEKQNRPDLIEPLACSTCIYRELCQKKGSSCKALPL